MRCNIISVYNIVSKIILEETFCVYWKSNWVQKQRFSTIATSRGIWVSDKVCLWVLSELQKNILENSTKMIALKILTKKLHPKACSSLLNINNNKEITKVSTYVAGKGFETKGTGFKSALITLSNKSFLKKQR